MSIPLPQLINAGTVQWRGDLSSQVDAIVAETSRHLVALNQSTVDADRRELLGQLFGAPLDAGTVVNPPFQIDFGPHTFIGKHVFINRDCFFVDIGGIYIEDHVLIGPRAMLISVGHEEEPAKRRNLVLKSVHIKHGAWLGANVTINPGVTVGANAIVGSGAVVTKDVPANTVVAGVPARILRPIRQSKTSA